LCFVWVGGVLGCLVVVGLPDLVYGSPSASLCQKKTVKFAGAWIFDL